MKVNSSTIQEVNYDGKDMTVTFVGDRIYVYKDVPAEVYDKFVEADSKGKFFHANIKESYACTRIK